MVDLKLEEDREGGSTGRAGPQGGRVHREGTSSNHVSVGFPASHSSLFACLFLLFRDTMLRL